MAALQYSLIPASTMKQSIDLKANGEVSRMRSHKGNMPSLPQTKYCSLCPAKFTRTTHLNRHLRSHTNERLHRCNICHAEFTRSDLLTRHKRTCGDSLNSNRSRRKSCQACAESKIKCDLQFPCSKCSSRGRECIFINDPEASRNKKYAASKKASQRSTSPKSVSDNVNISSAVAPGPTLLPDSSSQMYSSPYSTVHDSTISPSSSTFPMMHPSSSSLAAFESSNFSNSSGSSSTSSSHSSPRSEFFDSQQDVANSFDMGLDALTLDTHLNKLFSNNMFEPFLEQSFAPCSPQTGSSGIDFSWMEGQDFYPTLGGDEGFSFSQSLDDQHFMTPVEYPKTLTSNTSPVVPAPDLPMSNSMVTASNCDPSMTIGQPPAAELQHYLYLFFSAFSTQVPLLHPSTWQIDGKPPILVRAMQACGALFVKTRTAQNFITETLSSTRDILIQEFAKNPTDSVEQINLIIAVVLLQTIGLFHQRADQRVSSNVYHGMLVMMIRRTGLISRIASWVPPDLSDPNSLDAAWQEWTTYESIKRALLLSYLHDCCHCMYFSLSPSFQPAEFDINLPCDNDLWKAGSAREWLEVLQTPSPYGTGHARLMGVSMQQALASLSDMRMSTIQPTLNPFAHFILIHTILRNLYASRAENQSAEGLTSPTMIPAEEINGSELGFKEGTFSIQYALHNWLQTWLNGPESMLLEKSRDEPPFVCNALPFYWLAQVSLLAVQDGTSPLGTKSPDAKFEGRFRLMKQWLDHIRLFLRSGDQVPAHLWDELMKIRVQVSQVDAEGNVDSQDGLLAFFPEH